MEERKNRYSLPSNYLTLAQLQERWLKQQNQINQSESQEQNQQSPQQNHKKQPLLHAVPLSNGSASKSSPQKQYVVKNGKDSETHHRKTAAIEADNHQSVARIGYGDKTVDLDGKASKSKNKKKNGYKKKIRIGNPRNKTEERETRGEGSGARGEGSGTTALENEASEKATMESEVKEEEKKKGSLVTMEVEERVRVSPVEERIKVQSINSGHGKQKGRFGKSNNNFSSFHREKKNSGGANHGYVKGQRSVVGQEETEKKMVWVRKDAIEGEIET
ncbi:unnamed protein product [Sphenostylis stenocarpa]|uniref:Uncharacterized protein n=1 Tax=Sphenostylis stenocarpa TaxID=92480 RepID=A0AA86T1U0_9FABA|nr:unnamed protein product [Sphenostylis stenocarpa]